MTCFPPCSRWCECIGDKCRPTSVTINAVRFRTPDGRYLQAAGGLLVAAGVAAPGQAETFLFVSPAAWPLTSGAPISLDVAQRNAEAPETNWSPSGFLLRVDHNVKTFPPERKVDRLVSYEIGGPNARVFVSGPLPAGYPAYKADDPAEWTFDIVKLVGGAPASPGSPIVTGDDVVLRINSNWGATFFFRVTAASSGAEVHGDGTGPGQAGTVLRAEFNEVRSGNDVDGSELGWRPARVKCQSCSQVRVRVLDNASGNPLGKANVVAEVPAHPYSGTTASDGRTTLVDRERRNCVPQGAVQVHATHNRHQTRVVLVKVRDAKRTDVTVRLDCTDVRGKVVDTNGAPVAGVTVWLRDANKVILKDEAGTPYKAVTAADGSFVFRCVRQGFVSVWTTEDPTQEQTRVVPPEGWTNVVIVLQRSCGNIVGVVTNAETGQPIANATVTTSTGLQTTADGQGRFSLICVKPAGQITVFARAPGYTEEFVLVLAPTSGDSNPAEIKLHPIVATVVEYRFQLSWQLQPNDLDAHLSGPIITGGRFHLFFLSPAPVPYVALDRDGFVSTPPSAEIITIRRSPATAAGSFIAGEYHFWVDNFSKFANPSASYDGSSAVVTLIAVDDQGGSTQVDRFDVVNATGTADNNLWYVANLTLTANGTATTQVIQAFQPGDLNSEL
jgi:Carboxypeptidase regulatory-like domain